MDEFDFIEEKPKRRFRFGTAFLNLLSLGFFLATLAVGAFAVYLFFYPYSPYNPLPPVAPVGEPTPTEEVSILLDSAEEAAETPVPSEKPTTIPTATLTPTYEPGSYFKIQEGSPAALDASVFHPELGCDFLGVAGQAFGLDEAPIDDLIAHVSGNLDGEELDKVGLTGAATAYGAGEYFEVEIASEPIASTDALQITLRDADGNPISDPFSFSTTESCKENIIFINFVAIP
jgi:hypothetical protein